MYLANHDGILNGYLISRIEMCQSDAQSSLLKLFTTTHMSFKVEWRGYIKNTARVKLHGIMEILPEE